LSPAPIDLKNHTRENKKQILYSRRQSIHFSGRYGERKERRKKKEAE